MWMATRYGIPILRERLEGPDVLCWFVAGSSVFVCLFVAAFVGFWIEKGRITFAGFSSRFRLHRISFADLYWSLGTLVVCGILSAGILLLWKVTPLRVPNLSPSFLHMEPLTKDTYWVLVAWLPLFFFNIAGEELWWRGFILPRQEQQHDRAAWIIHGLLLALFHLPLGLDLTIVVSPFLFGLPFVVQRRKNIWTGFIVHGLLNGGGFLAVAFGVVG